MERNLMYHHTPFCSIRVAAVDQYMWPKKDNTERICENGLSRPIYSADGLISYMLPLEHYPPDANKIHPDIANSSNKPFFNARTIPTWNEFQTNYKNSVKNHSDEMMKNIYNQSPLYEGLYDN